MSDFCKEDFKEIYRRLNQCEKDIVTCQNNKDFFIKYLSDLKDILQKHEERNDYNFNEFSTSIIKLEKSHNIMLGVIIFINAIVLPIVFIWISKII
ncbi:MAG: hypothetical protein RBR07_04855 [Arcobacteraceae bacterium]|nr:hypothetical protein [Arcobacteraceae bacterium]